MKDLIEKEIKRAKKLANEIEKNREKSVLLCKKYTDEFDQKIEELKDEKEQFICDFDERVYNTESLLTAINLAKGYGYSIISYQTRSYFSRTNNAYKKEIVKKVNNLIYEECINILKIVNDETEDFLKEIFEFKGGEDDY